MELSEIIERWNTGEGKPYKGKLIDLSAYEADRENMGCMCAQGQVLHLLGGWEPRRLAVAEQDEADWATAELLGISRAHAVLLRNINDSVDGAPSIVLTNPETVLGDQAHLVLAFWRRLDRMSAGDWQKVSAAGDAARAAAWTAARDAAWAAARDAAWAAAWDAAWAAAWAAAGASNEIQGAAIMRERGQPFFFLPMFGINDLSELEQPDA